MEQKQEEIAIAVDHISKVYKLYDKPMDRMVEALGLTKKKKYREHFALSDVSFQVKKGECVGIIRHEWFRQIHDSKDYNRCIESDRRYSLQ